jgi:hypothetical protein
MVLFKLFPDTRVGLGGPLAGLTLNATGAFAGYLAAVLLGFYLTPEIARQISGAEATGRILTVPIKFADQDGRPVNAGRTSINVDFSPQLFKDGGNAIHVTFVESQEVLPTLVFNAQGFEQQRVDLEYLLHQNSAKNDLIRDRDQRRMQLKDAVVMRALPKDLTGSYMPSGQLQELH